MLIIVFFCPVIFSLQNFYFHKKHVPLRNYLNISGYNRIENFQININKIKKINNKQKNQKMTRVRRDSKKRIRSREANRNTNNRLERSRSPRSRDHADRDRK